MLSWHAVLDTQFPIMSLSFDPILSFSSSASHAPVHTLSHTHWLSLSLSHSHTHLRTLSLSISHSLSLSHSGAIGSGDLIYSPFGTGLYQETNLGE